MHIDDYLPNHDDLHEDIADKTLFSSFYSDVNDYGISSSDDSFLDEVMDDYHSQHDHYNPTFEKAPDSVISKLQSKVDEARHNVDVKKQNVHERQMQYNLHHDATTARHLNEAKSELAIAQRQLEDAKYKLNHAR